MGAPIEWAADRMPTHPIPLNHPPFHPPFHPPTNHPLKPPPPPPPQQQQSLGGRTVAWGGMAVADKGVGTDEYCSPHRSLSHLTEEMRVQNAFADVASDNRQSLEGGQLEGGGWGIEEGRQRGDRLGGGGATGCTL